MSISEFALQNMQRTLARNRNPAAAAARDAAKAEKWAAGEEKSLQDAIQKDCERRGYFVYRSRMDKKTTGRKGFPDLVVYGPLGKCVHIETKSGTNKPSEEQEKCINELRAAGQWVLVCWNFPDAIEFIKTHLL